MFTATEELSVFRDYISVIHLNNAEDQLSCLEILLSTKGYKNFLDHSIMTMRVSTVLLFLFPTSVKHIMSIFIVR